MKEQMLDKIEAYLNGEMTAQEEQQFDAEIAQNQELATAVDNFGVANDAIELLIEDNLRKELDHLKEEESATSNVVSINKNKPIARMRSLRTYLAAAASVALLLGFFGMNWAGDNYSNDALGTEFYADYQMPNVRSTDNTVHPFAEGMMAYTSGDYAKAVSFFQGIASNDARYAEAQFYLGNALLENKNYSEAAVQFKKVAVLKDIRYTDKAEWNQLIAQLSAGELNPDFQTLLSKITSDKDHDFNAKALALQSKLNSFWRKLVF